MTLLSGIDFSTLENQNAKRNYPKTVPGLTVQIDADFLAYQVSFDDTKSIDEMKHNAEMAAERLRLMAGAQHMELHLTPKESDKGGRYAIAMLKEYQGNRVNKPKPRYLHIIRDHLHKELGARLWFDCEADDGMAMFQYQAGLAGKKSIIASKDKDLQMVPGLALDWDTGDITDTGDNPFGWIELSREKEQPKIKGRGWKFFWAQMLTGDGADNISGLPKFFAEDKAKFFTCGAVKSFNLLDGISDNKTAYSFVRELYKDYSTRTYKEDPDLFYNPGYLNYRNNKEITWEEAFVSEAKLLWMRRINNQNDVLNWMKDNCL